jgi:LysE type translocator
VSPGPNFLLTARLAIARSRRAGLQAVSGIALGAVCRAAAGCFGVRTLFIAAPWTHWLIKAIGGFRLPPRLHGGRHSPNGLDHGLRSVQLDIVAAALRDDQTALRRKGGELLLEPIP